MLFLSPVALLEPVLFLSMGLKYQCTYFCKNDRIRNQLTKKDTKMFTDQYIISISDEQRLLLIEVLSKLQQTNPEHFTEDSPFEYMVECLQDLPEMNEDYPVHDLHS